MAGIVEGEGCPTWAKARQFPIIRVAMTDQDVIYRLADIWGVKRPKGYRWAGRPKEKTVWIVQIHAKKAVAWMMMLYDLLGQRRQARIRELLKLWKEKGCVLSIES